MAWIELHQALPTHWKTMSVANALGLSPIYIVGHLATFWLWALDNAPDSDVSRMPDAILAQGAQWPGDPAPFVAALLGAGFLDRDGDRTFIHDWQDYAGRLIDRRQANAERMRVARARGKPHIKEERAMHVQDTLHARAGATVPYPTVPNRTVPNQTVVPNMNSGAEGVETAPHGAASPENPDAKVVTDRGRADDYSDDFTTFWLAYPRKVSKHAAWQQWCKRLKGGTSPGDVIAAARHLSAQVERDGRDVEYIWHAATFIGPDRHYLDYVSAVPSPAPIARGSPKNGQPAVSNAPLGKNQAAFDAVFPNLRRPDA